MTDEAEYCKCGAFGGGNLKCLKCGKTTPSEPYKPTDEEFLKDLQETFKGFDEKAFPIVRLLSIIGERDELRIMQLAAISTVSMQNTEKTKKERIERANLYWTTAYQDTCDAVDREMAHRYKLAELEKEVELIKKDYLGACKTIAEMHEAAVGKVTGPKRGVVEDVADVRTLLADAVRIIKLWIRFHRGGLLRDSGNNARKKSEVFLTNLKGESKWTGKK